MTWTEKTLCFGLIHSGNIVTHLDFLSVFPFVGTFFSNLRTSDNQMQLQSKQHGAVVSDVENSQETVLLILKKYFHYRLFLCTSSN